MNSPTVGGAARTAWLLSASRLLAADPGMVHRETFLAALHEEGLHADGPRLSRWESGNQPVPRHVIGAYERVLRRPARHFTAVAGGIDRALASDAVKVVNGHSEPPPKRLDRLLELAEDGQPTGGDWYALATELQAFEHVFLPAQIWRRVTRRLVSELSRAVGPAFCRRYEACALLICSPIAQRHMLRAIGHHVTTTHAQVVAAPLTLLQEIPADAATDLVLRLMASDNPALRSASTAVAAAKLARGHFSDDELLQVAARTDQWLSGESRDERLDGLDLAAHLPEAQWRRVIGAVRHSSLRHQLEATRESFELLPADVTRAVCRALATTAQGTTPAPYATEPDAMLRRLLREALFHVHKVRRLHASFLLAASPYADAIGQGLVPLTQDSNDFLASRAWSLLGHVGHGGYRNEVARTALHGARPLMQTRALINLGMAPVALDDQEAEAIGAMLRRGAPAGVEYAATYALGMGAHPSLRQVAEQGTPTQQAAATWWLATGGAVHDADVAVVAREE